MGQSDSFVELRRGAQVTVVEVKLMSAERRLRARIIDPPGWISLENLDTGYRWAKRVEDRLGTYTILNPTMMTRGESRQSDSSIDLQMGAQVTVVEVKLMSAERLIRARIIDPPGWISLEKLDTGYRWAERVDDRPGTYTILHYTMMSKGESLKSDGTIKLQTGAQVSVAEVKLITAERLIRARIADPPGWISLENLDTGFRWAERVEDRPGTYTILDYIMITKGESRKSDVTIELRTGAQVTVVEVKLMSA